MSCQLYRHYDADGVLLYVGISHSALRRLTQHKCGAPWFKQIAKVEIENCPSEEFARFLECEAFKKEKPLYNMVTPWYDVNSPTLVLEVVKQARAEIYERAWSPDDFGPTQVESLEWARQMENEALEEWYRRQKEGK